MQLLLPLIVLPYKSFSIVPLMYNPVPYAGLSYDTVDPDYPANTALSIAATTTTFTGTITWTSVPGLPSPLVFAADGSITGTPTVVVASTAYVVTATDTSGASESDTITFGITGKCSFLCRFFTAVP